MEQYRLTDRGITECRGCSSSSLASVMDLGSQPLANELLPSVDAQEEKFPLHLRICGSCGLGQVGEYVLPERLFGNYPYLSSMSTSWISHSRRFARIQKESLGLSQESWVMEVASNDGYLLREFASLDVRVLGIEPADNIAQLAREKGVETRTAFFGLDLANQLRAECGFPALIVANNVMAHVPNLADFLEGLAVLCDRETLISIENPTLMSLMEGGQFDTIYHEHYSYLTAHAVSRAALLRGLELVQVEQLETHGGSNRYWLALKDARTVSSNVARHIQSELAAGLLNRDSHRQFRSLAQASIEGLRLWVSERKKYGRSVIAYGAAAKGNTLLNAAAIDNQVIRAVLDASPEKQGRFLPGSRIPIVAPEALPNLDANDILLLPWNLADEVSELVRKIAPKSTLWRAVPKMEIISS